MSNQRFPLHLLPSSVCSEVLKTMNIYEMISYSFLSKKAHSSVKALLLPISSVDIEMRSHPIIALRFPQVRYLKFKLKTRKISGRIRSLKDLPVSVKVLKGNRRGVTSKLTTLSNQGMNLEQWIRHLCSFSEFDIDIDHHAEFHVGKMIFDVQSLQNIFPKLESLIVDCRRAGTNERAILTAQTILRALLSKVRCVDLIGVPFNENLSSQHIGMMNLRALEIDYQSDLNIDDLCILNVESYTNQTNRISPRCLNRFFKLWIKGSNPRLRELKILCDTEIISDWNFFLRGLNAREVAAEEGTRKFTITNYRGVCAELEIDHTAGNYTVKFDVPYE